MLQVRGISKEYRTGGLVQRALDGVDLDLRDNEFVAILGPSGSGKTTLLNVIGGLDRYDSGDLIINGVSTKKYTDRDWDSYRNHTIGFVFQSYNLIPHQTVLSNVELALTISGISSEERRRRAADALIEVGLADHMHKKPNQLSGGQMQRVAIARALVNDPDILLADEPTGALDSETSVQVMDLLKQVASDRLVVMVTHNPELAEEYATRIVTLKDGRITSDSDPYDPDADVDSAVHRNLGHASMSFLTALGLSFNNLRTKLARTLLVAFAGSIGIIGIALILSLSTGVNRYIDDIEEETLSEYPVQIYKTSMDFSAMMQSEPSNLTRRNTDKDVVEYQTVTSLFSNVNKNDLRSFRDHIEDNRTEIDQYAKAVEYRYNVVPLIYRNEGDGVRKVNPDETYSAMGFGSQAMSTIQMFNMATDSFFQLPMDQDLYKDQYDVKAGRWPEKYNEVVVVLAEGDFIPDVLLYSLGLKDAKELDDAVKDFADGKDVHMSDDIATYDFDELLDADLKLVNAFECYEYDETYGVWSTRTDNEEYMKDLVEKSEDIEVVGVISPKPDARITMLQLGIGYEQSMVDHVIELASQSEIVQQQLKDKGTNVFTGKKFSDDESNDLDLSNMFSLNPDAIRNAFKFDTSALAMDPSDIAKFNLDLSGLNNMTNSTSVNITEDQLEKMFGDIMAGYGRYVIKNPSVSMGSLQDGYSKFLTTNEAQQLIMAKLNAKVNDAMAGLTEADIRALVMGIVQGFSAYAVEQGWDLTDPSNLPGYFEQYLNSARGRQALSAALSGLIAKVGSTFTEDEITGLAQELNNAYTKYAKGNGLTTTDDVIEGFTKYLASTEAEKIISKYISGMVDSKMIEKTLEKAIKKAMTEYMSAASSQIRKNIEKAFNIDTDAFADAFSMNMTEQDLEDLMMSLMMTETASYDDNLKTLGYAVRGDPYEIDIYPRDFENKESISDFITRYNKAVIKAGEDDKEIKYTDIVGTMMSSVTEIINAISYVLIAFVAISLVVSSIMIGVITYISVLERKKEIGVLRAIGASKRNISNVFNAETFIIGSLAGLMGIGISRLILIPGNALIAHLTTAPVRAVLPLRPAVLLIVLSIILTLIGGIIPSRKAANSDPVTALRVE